MDKAVIGIFEVCIAFGFQFSKIVPRNPFENQFSFYKQPDAKDCGPTCLRMIAKYYGKLISLKEIREISETTRSGSNLLKLSEAAESLGFKTIGAKLNFDRLKNAPLTLIVHWDKNHYVVVY
jgi:ATP-binding cassette subfamily B protein